MSRASRAKPEPDNAPSRFRLQHGDVEQTPIRYGDQRDADPNRPTVARARKSSDNPLGEFLARRLISPEAYAVGQNIARLHERIHRAGGVVNLNSSGGGSCDGLPYAITEAMSELHAMLKRCGATDHDRLSRGRVLIAVCGERRSAREIAGGGGRACQTVSNMLCNGLEALARAKEAA